MHPDQTAAGTDHTAFGASWDLTPGDVVAVLRATASGPLELAPVTVEDAAAAALVAHVWAHVLGASSLAAARYQLPGDTTVAVAALARAAGHRRGVGAADLLEEVADRPMPAYRSAETALGPALRWLRTQAAAGTLNPATVARAAAVDLVSGHGQLGTPALTYAGILLAAEADELTR